MSLRPDLRTESVRRVKTSWLKPKLALCFFALTLSLQAQPPTISRVTNGASLGPDVSPGALVTIFGANLGDTPADTSVSIGGLNAPVLFASGNQVNVQLPFNLPVGPATLAVTVRGRVSTSVDFTVAAYAPALLTTNGTGTGAGFFANAASQFISSAAPGQTVVAYAVGLGPTNPPSSAGTPSSTEFPCATLPGLTVGGVSARVLSAGLSARPPGVYQVAFIVPDVGAGEQDVTISIGGMNSPAVTLSVGRAPATDPSEQPATPAAVTATHSLRRLNFPRGTTPIAVNSLVSPLQAPKSVFTQTGSVHGTITYTCDPSVNAVAGVCNTLNTTIAGLYNNAFTNANASIYVTFGTTDLGESLTALNLFSYGSFRTALLAAATDTDDTTALADSVPPTNPFGTDSVAFTNANARALGFGATSGLTPNSDFCSSGTAGCYDGIVTLSRPRCSPTGDFYFRTGSITSNQFDFYTVVEHETDEVLGTASCAFGCNFGGTVAFSPADLFRYQSNGARSFAADNNNSCSSSNTGNACFSIDGVHMLQQYNNLNNGDDAGDWVVNCGSQLVQDAGLCPGQAGLDISPTAEIRVLDVIGFNLVGALSIAKTHAGNFIQAQQNAQYTVTVSNASGAATTSGTVTVTETPPSGLTLVSMAGQGWTCPGTAANNCTRTDALSGGASYPPITVTVNVAANAGSPQVNSVNVSGGGSATASTTDSTVIDPGAGALV